MRMISEEEIQEIINRAGRSSVISRLGLDRLSTDEIHAIRRDIFEGRDNAIMVGSGDHFIGDGMADIVADVLDFSPNDEVRNRLIRDYNWVGIMSEYGGRGNNDTVLFFTRAGGPYFASTTFITSVALHHRIERIDSKQRPHKINIHTHPKVRHVEWFSVSTEVNREFKEQMQLAIALENI